MTDLYLGKHVLVDMWNCEASLDDKVIDIETVIGNACRALMPSEVKTRFERRGEGLPGM